MLRNGLGKSNVERKMLVIYKIKKEGWDKDSAIVNVKRQWNTTFGTVRLKISVITTSF